MSREVILKDKFSVLYILILKYDNHGDEEKRKYISKIIPLCSFSYNRTIRYNKKVKFRTTNNISALCSKDGKYLIIGFKNGVIQIWDISKFVCKNTFIGHIALIRCLITYKDWIISGAFDSDIRIWDFYTGECSYVLSEHVDYIMTLKLLDENKLISASYDGEIYIWNLNTLEKESSLHTHETLISMDIESQKYIIAAFLEGSVKKYSISSLRCELSIDYDYQVLAMTVSPMDRIVISSIDDKIRTFTSDGRLLYTCHKTDCKIINMFPCPMRNCVLVCSENGEIFEAVNF